MRYDERGFGRGQGRARAWMDRAEEELRHGWERVAGNRGGAYGREVDRYDREYGVTGRLGHGPDAGMGGPGWRYSGNEGLARGWTGGAHRGPAPHELDAGTAYDGDYGYRGGEGGRGWGDRAESGLRRAWDRARDAGHRAFGGGYDGDFGGGRNARGWGSVGAAGRWDASSPAGYDVDGNRYDAGPDPYDRDFRRGYLGSGFDRDDGGKRADRHRKTQAETDFGDPFGDRAARTPIRVLRGGFQDRGDRHPGGGRMDNPGYDPYRGPGGTYGAYGGGYNRGYDAGFRDWF